MSVVKILVDDKTFFDSWLVLKWVESRYTKRLSI